MGLWDWLTDMKTRTPVAILVRVSTKKQETDRQISELRLVATSRDWEVVEVVEEAGVSGSSDERPGLERILELAQAKKIKKVMVHEVSRVARKNSIAHHFLEDLHDAGVSLYWHSQGIETLLANGKVSPAAAIMFALLSEMARYENEERRERILSGLEEARRKGVKLGRPKGSGLAPGDLAKKHPKVVKYLESGDHSLREIGRLAGVSAMTVKRVKEDIAA